jgi:predicted transposase/invertase (TIGR01784 family)
MTEETEHHDKTVFWDRMRKYFIILENFDFQKKAPPTLKDCWIEIIKNLGSDMYRIDPSVYECADSALLELIEKAKVSALTDDELVRYEAGLKALEDAVDFEELLSDSVREAREKSFAEGRSEGVAEGIAKGIIAGKTQTQIETAKRMLSMKMDVDTIAQISGLSVEEVGKLG